MKIKIISHLRVTCRKPAVDRIKRHAPTARSPFRGEDLRIPAPRRPATDSPMSAAINRNSRSCSTFGSGCGCWISICSARPKMERTASRTTIRSRASGIGGDPFASGQLPFAKRTLYDLRVNFRQSHYYWDRNDAAALPNGLSGLTNES